MQGNAMMSNQKGIIRSNYSIDENSPSKDSDIL